MTEKIEPIVEELSKYASNLITVFGYSEAAVRLWIGQISLTTPIPENPDPPVYWSNGDPNRPETLRFDGWRRSRVLAESAIDGVIVTSLSQQLIVNLFSAWEHNYRVRLGRALGCAANEIKVPFFGDFRHLRDDVLHCHGKATKKNTGKCELFHWFNVGDTIRLNPEMLSEILRMTPWTDILNMCGFRGFSPHSFRLISYTDSGVFVHPGGG